MATKDQVHELYRKHPHWSSFVIAHVLNMSPEYVRATMRRVGRSFQDRTLRLDRYLEREACAQIAEQLGSAEIAQRIRNQ
jgi:hypothetical protein